MTGEVGEVEFRRAQAMNRVPALGAGLATKQVPIDPRPLGVWRLHGVGSVEEFVPGGRRATPLVAQRAHPAAGNVKQYGANRTNLSPT